MTATLIYSVGTQVVVAERRDIELVYVEPPMRVLLRQNRDRAKSVPESVINKLAAKVEPPTCLEGRTVILSAGDDMI